MTTPFVSVILPVYNRSVSLARAIESVLCQQPPPDELIVVDDGSEEDLSPILSRYAGRIGTLRQSNGGGRRRTQRRRADCEGKMACLHRLGR